MSLSPLILLATSGSDQGTGRVKAVWGTHGVSEGRLQKPRAMAISDDDEIYIVDMTARIQVYDRDGNFQRGWRTPISEQGRPTGLSFDNDGNLLVADTHYYRMLVYTPQGDLLTDRILGGTLGNAPGEFGMVTDCVQDSKGNYYIAEYGEYDRIQKFTRDGEFIFQWGGHGAKKGEFVRPQNLAIDANDHIWVADACNHRIQVFDARGKQAKLVRCWGEQGEELGKLDYPYDLVLDGKGHVLISEWGNHRVQKFTLDGESVGHWGNMGREQGELHNPWALVRDQRGDVFVLDTYNHRVQRIRL